MNEGAVYEFKYYLNGFPKSGLHLVAGMLGPIARPMPANGVFQKPWAGTFLGNSWTGQWADTRQVLYKAGRLRAGHYLKAHTGYKPEIDQFLWYHGAAHVFIYRDLRDVAVSQAYHILSEDDDRHAHPDKERYRALGDFDKVLSAVIAGMDEYPGVVERWRMYAPWLAVDWVHKVRFEDAIDDPDSVARELLLYGYGRAPEIFGRSPRFDEGALDLAIAEMVNASRQREQSPTFRRGQPGEWREAFTDEHKRLFKGTDREGWLVKLEYADGADW